MEPMGAEFDLPQPFLWQHDQERPIGEVFEAKPQKDGIYIRARVSKVNEPGRLKDRLDEAWQSIKLKLVRGLSIGFTSIEHAYLEDTRGIHFLKWAWLELSAVTIPANAEASIQTIKSIDTKQRAASGRELRSGVALIPSPPASRETPPPAIRGPVKLIPRKYREEDNRRPDQGSGEHARRKTGAGE